MRSASALSVDSIVGPVGSPTDPTPGAAAAAAPAAAQDAQVDPDDWFEDPVVWLVLIAAIGTGIIGFRFHWGPGVSASAKVDLGDETASVLGHAFATMAVIVIFKIFAIKSDIPGLLKVANAI